MEPYLAQFYHEGKQVTVGYYPTPDIAFEAINNKLLKLNKTPYECHNHFVSFILLLNQVLVYNVVSPVNYFLTLFCGSIALLCFCSCAVDVVGVVAVAVVGCWLLFLLCLLRCLPRALAHSGSLLMMLKPCFLPSPCWFLAWFLVVVKGTGWSPSVPNGAGVLAALEDVDPEKTLASPFGLSDLLFLSVSTLVA